MIELPIAPTQEEHHSFHLFMTVQSEQGSGRSGYCLQRHGCRGGSSGTGRINCHSSLKACLASWYSWLEGISAGIFDQWPWFLSSWVSTQGCLSFHTAGWLQRTWFSYMVAQTFQSKYPGYPGPWRLTQKQCVIISDIFYLASITKHTSHSKRINKSPFVRGINSKEFVASSYLSRENTHR